MTGDVTCELAECAYCGRETGVRPMHAVSDDESWREELAEHAPGCEWALSRAFRTAPSTWEKHDN